MQADYVIVGAGSAGCAMAYRLAEADHSVLVIEHGGTDAGRLTVAPQSVSITFAWMAGSRRLRMSSARGRSASGISCRRRMARSTVSGGGADMEG